jgi:hypothetical protein
MSPFQGFRRLIRIQSWGRAPGFHIMPFQGIYAETCRSTLALIALTTNSVDPLVIDAIFGPAFLIIGLSHLLQPNLWVRFFATVKQTGVAAAIIPLYTLPFGLVLIATHNIWTLDWPLFLTIAGWGMTIKSAAYLLVPTLADRMLEKKMATTTRGYQFVGGLSVFFGAIITWQSWKPLL